MFRLLGRIYYSLDGEENLSGTHAPRGIDNSLRQALRAEVAGAAPRADAWQRLQQRLQQEAPHKETIASAPYLPPPPAHSPTWRAWAFSGLALSRFSQVGAALLVLVLMLGDVAALDRQTTARMPAVSDAGPPAPLAFTRPSNRPDLADAPQAAPPAVTVPENTAEDKAVQAAIYIPSPPSAPVLYMPTSTIYAIRPDGGIVESKAVGYSPFAPR